MAVGRLWQVNQVERQLAADVAGYQRQATSENKTNDKGRLKCGVVSY
jgi:hypothetical protein